jgi:cytoskeletal protein RodZ
MYFRVTFLLCILNVIVFAKSQEGYEPEFIIIQPPAPSPPSDYDPHAPLKPEPTVEAKAAPAPAAPKSVEKPEVPPPKEEPSKPAPPPRPHPKALPQKVEAQKEPKNSEPQADESKAPPQNFKFDDCLSDTIFVIDSTSSVRNLFEQHRIYASNVVKEMDISPETNHIGVVLYSSKQRQSIKISLSDPQNKENISAKINCKKFLDHIFLELLQLVQPFI